MKIQAALTFHFEDESMTKALETIKTLVEANPWLELIEVDQIFESNSSEEG